jgi:hypothetical protein
VRGIGVSQSYEAYLTLFFESLKMVEIVDIAGICVIPRVIFMRTRLEFVGRRK